MEETKTSMDTDNLYLIYIIYSDNIPKNQLLNCIFNKSCSVYCIKCPIYSSHKACMKCIICKVEVLALVNSVKDNAFSALTAVIISC